MSGKPGCDEAAKLHARQGPDGKMKAELPEPQCPNCKPSGREWRMTPEAEPVQDNARKPLKGWQALTGEAEGITRSFSKNLSRILGKGSRPV